MLLPQHSQKNDKPFKTQSDKIQQSEKSINLTYFLWLLAGYLGVHRFYLRCYLTGLIQFLLFVTTVILIEEQVRDVFAYLIPVVIFWWAYDFSNIKNLVQAENLVQSRSTSPLTTENPETIGDIDSSKAKKSQQLSLQEQSPKLLKATSEEFQDMRNLFGRWDQTKERVVQMIDYLDDMNNILSNVYGAQSREVAEALGYLGNSYFVAEQYEDALRSLKSAFAINRSFGEFEKLDRNTVLMANSYIHLGALDDAELIYIDLVSRMKGLSRSDCSGVARACYHLAGFYAAHNQPLKAGYMYIDAMQYYYNIPATNNLFKLQLVREMSANLIERKKYHYADIWLKQVVADVPAESSSLAAELALCHIKLAELYTRFGMYELAEESYLSATKILTPFEQIEGALLRESIFNLGNIYHRQEKYAECVDMAHQLVQLCERSLGIQHESSLNARCLRSEAQEKLKNKIPEPISKAEPIVTDKSEQTIKFVSHRKDMLKNAQQNAERSKTHFKPQEKPALKDKYIFEKVKWYLVDFPEDLETEQAYMYGGVLLGSLADHDLLNTEFSEQVILNFKNRKVSCVDLYCGIGECIFGEDLIEEGFFFMLYYYDGKYAYDFAQVLLTGLPSIFHVQNTWENYELIAAKIDQRYRDWKSYF